jgi:hypothetical protein
MKVRRFGKTVSERCEYARKEEFVGVFDCERVGLQRLAILLTANSEAAKRCLSRAFQECIASTSFSKEMGSQLDTSHGHSQRHQHRHGPRRSVVRQHERRPDDGFAAFSPDDSPGVIAAPESILDLPEFERFVFVICVLERYSIHDCALLLGKSPRHINEARQRVGNQVAQIDGLSNISQRFAMR